MGENLGLPERDAIRTPMQWDDTPNAGFSRADPAQLPRPVIADGEYSYHRINVTDQRRDPNSLLVWFERMLHNLRECEEIGSGDHTMFDVEPPHVLVHLATGETGTMLFIHNLADVPCRLDVRQQARPGRPARSAAQRRRRRRVPGEDRPRRGRAERLRIPLDPVAPQPMTGLRLEPRRRIGRQDPVVHGFAGEHEHLVVR